MTHDDTCIIYVCSCNRSQENGLFGVRDATFGRLSHQEQGFGGKERDMESHASLPDTSSGAAQNWPEDLHHQQFACVDFSGVPRLVMDGDPNGTKALASEIGEKQ